MASNQLITAFNSLNAAAFQWRTNFILGALTDNPHFPGDWPAPVPSLAQLRQEAVEYHEAYTAVQLRDLSQINRRDEARARLTRSLQRVAAYLELVADGDIDKLKSTGFELRREGGRPTGSGAAQTPPGMPDNFRVGLGPRAGTLQVDAAPVRGGFSCEIHTSQGNPLADTDWKSALTVRTVRRTVVDNQPAGPTWVRMRAVSANGLCGPWTSPISVIVE